MSSDACIITRKFGLRPAELGVNLTLDTFSKFEKVVNTMIKVGIKLDEEYYQKNGLTAVKRFYDRVRVTPQLSKIKDCGLRERVFRCASQYAYFSTKEYKTRGKLVSILADLINSESDLSFLFKKKFPSRNLLLRARRIIIDVGLDVCVSYQFLKNMFLYLRNILKKRILQKYSTKLDGLISAVIKSGDLKTMVVSWLQHDLELVLKSFLRKVSRFMTKRVNRVREDADISLGEGYFDAAIIEILQKQGYTIRDWKKARKKWRASHWKTLKKDLKAINVHEVADRIPPIINSQLSPERVLSLLTKHKIRLPWVYGTSFGDFLAFLEAQAVEKAELGIAKRVISSLLTELRNSLKEIENSPWCLLKKPHFQGQCIPLGIDDGQVYNLQINRDQENDLITGILVRLSLRPREKLLYEVKTRERFIEMVNKGLEPKRGVLTRKAGGGLVLIIPFQSGNKAESGQKCHDSDLSPGRYKVGAIDLGLKTFATISIDECVRDLDGNWERENRSRGDSHRLFLDQRQLLGKHEEWFLKNQGDDPEFINFKRKLVNLQKASKKLQSKMKIYSNNHPTNYRHKVKYRKLRDAYKSTWRKIKNIHRELVRQIATRSIAFLQFYGVHVLRLEDLSWAKHVGKNEAGYFLSTMQVHWFFSQVQEKLTEMAHRSGIHVEKVVAGGTSQRCWRCGRIGIRRGKIFMCPYCGVEIDSDLNGSRNILVAPNSPNAIRVRGRRPFPPHR
jgi:transposase